MAYLPEPPYAHGSPARTGVLLVNLGTPDEATAPEVRRYLAEFLWDPRVVEIPRAAWWVILRLILVTRPARSAAKYASVWTKDGSPLRVHLERQVQLLRGYLGERGFDVDVRLAMRYGEPSIPRLLAEMGAANTERVLVLPMYTRPEPPVSAQWPSGPAYRPPETRAGAPLAADLGWRDYFTDPRLQALIETGLRNNRDLRAATLNVERARALYRIQQAEILPAVDASDRLLDERVPGTINGDGLSYTVKQYRAEVGVTSWEIDFFGRIRSLAQSAWIESAAAGWSRPRRRRQARARGDSG